MRRLCIASAAVTVALLAVAATARAEITFLANFEGASGKVSTPAGIAINATTGNPTSTHLYVADRGNHRVSQFTTAGAGTLVRAWGFDVVSSGPGNKPLADEVQEIVIRATSGSFALSYGAAETTQLPYNAPAAEVQAALNGLSTISNNGGAVSVGGGPGGTSPYVVTFSAGTELTQKNLNPIVIEPSGLGIPGGTQLTCLGEPNPKPAFLDNEFGTDFHPEYQWLANGAPIGGATSTTFTPGASEEGKAIQCQVTITTVGLRTMATSRPYNLASPAPSPLPPLGPSTLAAPTGNPVLESAGGVPLTCDAGAWTRVPTTYTYQWYRNGVPIGTPTTTTASTTDQYMLTQADVATQAVFQCAVTGHNAGGSSTTFSRFRSTLPEQEQPPIRNASAVVTTAVSGRSEVITRNNGGVVFEICSPSAGDTCKAGVAGNGVGQFGTPRSVAVDSSAGGEGAVYVKDDLNQRVQKFSATGTPILMIGGEVDLTTHENVCTVASGHVCGGGVPDRLSGIGEDNSTPGFFGGVLVNNSANNILSELGNQLGVDAAGNVYVGDQGNANTFGPGRIEKFSSSGSFISQAKLPFTFSKEVNFPPRPLSTAVDSGGTAYATQQPGIGSGGMERFRPSEFDLTGIKPQRPGNVVLEDNEPVQIAVDPRNDRILVSDRNRSKELSVCNTPPTVTGRAILEYDPALNQIDCTIPSGPGILAQVTGMAVLGPSNRLYVAIGSQNLIKIFKLPTSVAPVISAQSATDITTESARIHGQINPGFEDTTYSVEYGLEDCTGGGCTTAEGGTLHGLKTADGSAPIQGLQPATTYHYRVVAENVLGTVKGPDRTFTTFPLVDLVNDPCSNALARKQTKTVGLLDCRAYELVSSSFAGGYDVVSNLVPGQTPFDGYPEASGKVLYGVKDGGIPGTGKPTNRGIDPYVASRDNSFGWSTSYFGIPSDNPFATTPFSSTLLGADQALSTLAFGGPEICSPCFADGSSGVPVRLPSGELIQGMAGSIPNPSATPAGKVAEPLSADGSHLLFGSASQFEAGGNAGSPTIYSRNLSTGTTEVVSTDAAGVTLTGEVGELDISTDGSRILVGKEVSTDSRGNTFWHPYLHRAGTAASTDLAPGTTTGALFAGMTADGSRVLFTTKDKLLGGDTDESADIYAADVDPGGSSALSLVSVKADGTPSNSDACSPSNEPDAWNWPTGNGKCSALAFAGGAGLASADGTFYFLSPEQLDGSEGTQDQPNLYIVRPGESPDFVATIDTSVGKPGPSAAVYPLVKSNFGGGSYGSVEALTVDQTTNDLYAIDAEAGKVYRYDQNGAPQNFSAGTFEGNALTGLVFGGPSAAQVAVDNSGGPLSGDIYVAGVAGVKIFAQSGEELGTITGSGANKGPFGAAACGVAVDPAGVVYIGDFRGYVWRYAPNAPVAPLTDADYTVTGLKPSGMQPCAVAADGGGRVYASQVTDGPVRRFTVAGFLSGAPPTSAGAEVDESSRALAVDPATNELYVDEGNQIVVFDATGNQLRTIGQGKLACGELGSRGVAVNKTSHHVYASCFSPSSIKEFGYEVPAFTPVDNPAILHATGQSETHSYGDFQVTPEGSYAIFSTTRPLKAGYDNGSRHEVYRHDAGGGGLVCVSCSPTESQAQSDSVLPPNGLGVLEDGRVFFNTGEQLTLSDTNGKLDAYEWSPQRTGAGGCQAADGCQQLISTGTSAYPAGLLTVSSDGTDAFFFTREVLVPEDRNGEAMKVYDARTEGGFFVIPPPPPCAASDECHGPGTEAADPPQIASFKGTGGQAEEPPRKKTCRKGFVKRRGKCVRKPRKHKKRPARSNRGGRR